MQNFSQTLKENIFKLGAEWTGVGKNVRFPAENCLNLRNGEKYGRGYY